jgi:hypothetical protein
LPFQRQACRDRCARVPSCCAWRCCPVSHPVVNEVNTVESRQRTMLNAVQAETVTLQGFDFPSTSLAPLSPSFVTLFSPLCCLSSFRRSNHRSRTVRTNGQAQEVRWNRMLSEQLGLGLRSSPPSSFFLFSFFSAILSLPLSSRNRLSSLFLVSPPDAYAPTSLSPQQDTYLASRFEVVHLAISLLR